MPSTSAAGDGDARGPTARASSSSAQKVVIPVPPRGSVTTVFAVTKPELLTDPVVQALKASVEAASSNGRSFRLHLGCALEDFPSDALADPGSGSGDDPAALLWWFGDAKVLDRILLEPVGSRVAWIHSGSAGVEHILAGAPTVKTHPAPLTNARGAFSSSLGEWALFGMMWFAKKVARMRDAHREGRWMRESVGVLSGKTCAIVGYGDIGRAVAVRAKAFGMRVVALRRNPERYKEGDEMVDEMAALGEIRRVAAEGDFVVLALPHTSETEGMFSRDVIAAMKPNATLVNVGRGAVVDEEALIEALREGRIKGAALDVTATEPLPEGHPLYDLEEKALLSFHCADLTEDYYELSFATFEKHLEAYAGGRMERMGGRRRRPRCGTSWIRARGTDD